MDIRDALAKAWHFLWHEESVWSWLANVAVAFVLIKWVLYPLAGALLGTSLPVVAVVSGSMDHGPADGVLCGERVGADAEWWAVCGEWYEERNITRADFEEFIFPNGFWKGDVMLLKGFDPERVAVGDVIVFQSGKQYPIIHRVVRKWRAGGEWRFTTKGDHNEAPIEEYVLSDGRHLYRCYQDVEGAIRPSLCGPGAARVDADVPGAQPLLDEKGVSEDIVVGEAIGRIPLAGWVKIGFVELVGGVTQVI